jgi:WS/DGAT/MGAT family acyltransferase
MQPTTMAMLLMLDSPPEELRLRLAFERAVAAVPRLAQRVVDAPLDLTLPRWEFDPTFDLDYHVRRHPLCGRADMDELFREVGPFYETAFDRSRPLWEARLYDGLGPDHQSALFFKLHHAVADGVGGNAIFAALTDAEREPAEPVSRSTPQVPGAWAPQRPLGARLLDAIRNHVQLDVERAGAAAGAVVDTIEHPENVARLLAALRSIIQLVRFESDSPLKNSAGRVRRLSGLDLPFAEVRSLKHQLGGSMIDVILTIMALAIGKWYAAHRISKVRELMTLVPVNLRKPEEWAAKPHVGNVATGILVPLPIRRADPLAAYREVHKRMEAKKADPLSTASPMLAELLSCLPHALVTWMAEATFGRVDFIITNIPGILVPRYLAGAEIVAAYPFAPVAMKSPVSVALYGYRDRLFVGLNSDDMLMPDIDAFKGMILEAFEHLRAAIGRRQSRTARRRRVP